MASWCLQAFFSLWTWLFVDKVSVQVDGVNRWSLRPKVLREDPRRISIVLARLVSD